MLISVGVSIQPSSPTTASEKQALAVFRAAPAGLRTAEAIRRGVHPRTLYALRDRGVLQSLSRGLYRLAQLPPLGDPDLVTVAQKVPGGVVCLISALAYHELTTQIPHAVHLALERGSEPSRIEYPPVELHWFAPAAFRAGVQAVNLDGATVRVYDAEKTLADCFKYRRRIGMDVVLEALREWRGRRNRHVHRLLEYARTDRVEHVMRPYVEALA